MEMPRILIGERERGDHAMSVGVGGEICPVYETREMDG